MESEYQSLLSNGTWTLCDLPPHKKAIKCKWVYKTKRDVLGHIERHKARLVIKGYSQRKGEDYDETYAPVVRHSSLRYLFALSVKLGLKIEQMDVVTAFLHDDLNDEIYMEQPLMFISDSSKVCRLNKALYGLKQASRIWNIELDEALKSFGCQQSPYDNWVYFKIIEGKIIIVVAYVDDLIILYNDVIWLQNFKKYLHGKFQMKDLGPANQCLGIRIEQTDDCITLDQETYIVSLLEKFNMHNCKPVSTPMSMDKLSTEDCPKTQKDMDEMKDVLYQEAIGCLIYLSQSTRPDICFAVNKLSCFNSNPGKRHWSGVKHLFRYLRGTSSYRLKYRKYDSDIMGCSDAD